MSSAILHRVGNGNLNVVSSLSFQRNKLMRSIHNTLFLRNENSVENAETQPDSKTTILADKYEYKRWFSNYENATRGFHATWLNALKERKKQLSQGKIIDSYVYNTVKSTDIEERTRQNSFSYLILPFKEDPITADFYVNAGGRIRMGQIFQDLDALAGRIAYKHTAPAEPVIVTASVDRIYLLKNIDCIANYNIILSGSVVWTGRSSMEIAINASAIDGSVPKEITSETLKNKDIFLTASFTFVARNPETHKSMAINTLLPLDQQEWLDFRRAESHNVAKKIRAKNENLDVNLPTSEESSIIHKMWQASKEISNLNEKPKNVMFMKETILKSTMFMQPQYRNRHSYMIFGGYLMRQTFELAYCTASAFSHSLPRFISLDATTFKAPVPVGSILHMNANVVYTEHLYDKEKHISSNLDFPFQPIPLNNFSINVNGLLSKPGTVVQVKVDTTVQELTSNNQRQSGSFIFSFFIPKDTESAEINSPGYCAVIPETYSEMIEYIEGRRRANDTYMYAKTIKRTKTV